MKTSDAKPRQYPHTIESIHTDGGETAKHFFITFANDEGEEKSFVRLSLERNCELIDVEVNFSGMPQNDMEAVVLFTSQNLNNSGTFYTDSNGLGIVKRTMKFDKSEQEFLSYEAPANYYPINTAIFIEDKG